MKSYRMCGAVLQGVWRGPTGCDRVCGEVLQDGTGCVGRSYRVGQGVWGGPTGCVGQSYRVCGEVLQGGTGCVGRSYRVRHEEELNGSF